MPSDKRRAPKKERVEKLKGSGGKSGGKKPKDSQLVIRINAVERDRFVELCDRLDTSAAREIRGFIRDFCSKHEDGGSS
ncbi:MAG: hypothetical protein AAFX08_07500 [Pseudomonadota bacterium]